MRYTNPTILNESKATSLIMGQTFKLVEHIDSNPPTPQQVKTDGSAYEADE